MDGLFIDYLFILIYIMAGSWEIKEAVIRFKEKHYFLFGLSVMWVFFWCLQVIKITFVYL